MKYISTRDVTLSKKYSSAEVIKHGIAEDSGLFLPEYIPITTLSQLQNITDQTYSECASSILNLFMPEYGKKTLINMCKNAYGYNFENSIPVATHKLINGNIVMELWHGPTCAFKDLALQLLPHLLVESLRITDENRVPNILVATSGDTGKAALEGFKNIKGTQITVFYPQNGVSEIQKLQMQTQIGANVNVCAIEGNFDDAQNGVKKLFADREIEKQLDGKGFFLSSANSINWGRLVPQIIYYIYTYFKCAKDGEYNVGDKVNFCVPTGNFGNIFAAYLAKLMGLPIQHLICASNSNNVLTDFIKNGIYNKNRKFYSTISPSMDILISSNLERLLYILSGPEYTKKCMNELYENQSYEISSSILSKIDDTFYGFFCNEKNTSNTINDIWNSNNYLIDPHTAVAINCAEQYSKAIDNKTKMIIASTANAFKFPSDVISSLGIYYEENSPKKLINKLSEITNNCCPKNLMQITQLPVRFTDVIVPEMMSSYIIDHTKGEH